MRRLTCDQIRRIDRMAIEELGIPGVVLMENAGRRAAAVVRRLVRRRLALSCSEARVVIVCGGGNNGGDGYVIARHLANWGLQVEVYSTVDPQVLGGDAATNATIAGRMGLAIHPIIDSAQLAAQCGTWSRAHVLVDALLGTGFRGPIRDHAASVIRCVNESGAAMVVAVDIPSGLDGDSGEAPAGAVKADVTVTFVAAKQGFDAPFAKALVGRVVVAGIGIPPWLADRVAAPGAE